VKEDPFYMAWVEEKGQPPGPGSSGIEFGIARTWFAKGRESNEELRAEIERLSSLLKDILE